MDHGYVEELSQPIFPTPVLRLDNEVVAHVAVSSGFSGPEPCQCRSDALNKV